MRNAGASLISYLSTHAVSHRADLYTVTLVDGTVFRWTSWDADLVMGGNTFTRMGAVVGDKPLPLLTRSRVKQSSRLKVSTLDVTLKGPSWINGTLVAQLATGGYFDGGRMLVEHLIMPMPGDTSLGTFILFEGGIAYGEPAGGSAVLRVKCELEKLNLLLPRNLVQPGCNNVLYDANCGISKAAYTVSGSVASATYTTITAVAGTVTGYANNWFNLGVIRFTSGALNGQRYAVRTWTSPAFTMALPLTTLPAAGDTFVVFPGCDRTRARCLALANLSHYRGYPHVPAAEGGGF